MHSMTTEPISPYATGTTQERIEQALLAAGLQLDTLSAAELETMEDFHILGRLATNALVELASVTAADRVLDAGSGIGGTARYVAKTIGSQVTTVDLTPEYCATARWLNTLVGLSDLIDVREGNVLDLPFADGSFDVVFSQHVQMNIADKPRLYAEAWRVLAPGGRLALWDATAGPVQPIHFPVMWADSAESSHLVSTDRLRELVADAGFEVSSWNDLTTDAAQFMRAWISGGQPSPLGLGVFVPNFGAKLSTFLDNLDNDRARLIQAVLVKPA
jgi:sarcosine/dimethylglycine N-methyltransferase